jgi:hypothetical protein
MRLLELMTYGLIFTIAVACWVYVITAFFVAIFNG